MSVRLNQLIRSVRACKTADDERSIIAKECAQIRTAFKEEDNEFRHRNVMKLLFIHMLGYPSHFGQMECLKLIACSTFPLKRIGYLALMILVDERSEVLTLATNSVQTDMHSKFPIISGLALMVLGNIASDEMCHDLGHDAVQLLSSSHSSVRKKAACSLVRCVTRTPEIVEEVIPPLIKLFAHSTHGVMIAACHLLEAILLKSPESRLEMKKLIPTISRHLKSFAMSPYTAEYDVGGICDPFLQVYLLRSLRLLCVGVEDGLMEGVNDVLAQVASNTETTRNSGYSVLYECVRAIVELQTETGLRILGVNVLGKFLMSRDNNIRYVALHTLCQVVNKDIQAVQRHRLTIVECLKDPDVSIRQRALELVYSLVNDSNVKTLVREMLNYLVVAEGDEKALLCSKISDVVERYGPSPRWRIDTLVTMLSIAGNCARGEITSSLIALITQTSALHSYVVHKLFELLQSEKGQRELTHVAVWCTGEYGGLLLEPMVFGGEDGELAGSATVRTRVEIVELLKEMLSIHRSSVVTKGMILNAAAKLASRFGGQDAEASLGIADILKRYRSSMEVELQQRSVEYNVLVGEWSNLAPEALKRLPPVEKETLTSTGRTISPALPTALGADGGADDDLLGDLLDLGGGGGGSEATAAQTDKSSADILADLLGDLPSTSVVVEQPAPPPAEDILGAILSGAPVPPPPVAGATAFDDGVLKIAVARSVDFADKTKVTVTATAINLGKVRIDSFSLQSAVPKTFSQTVEPPSDFSLAPNGRITQVIRVTDPSQGGVALRMRLKIEFSMEGKQVVKMVTVNEF